MRLSRLQMPQFPAEKDFAIERISQLRNRDAQIRHVINQNDSLSESHSSHIMSGGGRPNLSATLSNADTEVTIVETPPPGTSRLVNSATIYKDFGSAYPFTLLLDDGSNNYNVFYNSSIGWTTAHWVPAATYNRPFVLENGWTLKGFSSAAASDEFHLTASWSDDVPRGTANSRYRIAASATDATNWFTLVESPPPASCRLVHLLTVSNDDSATHDYLWGLYDIGASTRYYIYCSLAHASGVASILEGGREVIVIPNGWRLDAASYQAQVANPGRLTAHYYECDEDDAGEG